MPSPDKNTLEVVKWRIDVRLNDHLCEMKEGYDDSITGFNEAWSVVSKVFEEELNRCQV